MYIIANLSYNFYIFQNYQNILFEKDSTVLHQFLFLLIMLSTTFKLFILEKSLFKIAILNSKEEIYIFLLAEIEQKLTF